VPATIDRAPSAKVTSHLQKEVFHIFSRLIATVAYCESARSVHIQQHREVRRYLVLKALLAGPDRVRHLMKDNNKILKGMFDNRDAMKRFDNLKEKV